MICCWIKGLPWQLISTVSSPVKLFGPLKRVMTTSSRGLPFSFKIPTCAVCDDCLERSLEGKSALAIETALSPLSLMTAIADTPDAVAKATIVSSHPDNLLIMLQRYEIAF